MKNVILKIKKRETTFYRFMYDLIIFFLRFSVPVNGLTRPFFKILYSFHVFMQETITFVLKSFYYEPMFRSQCTKVGKHLLMEGLPYITGFGNISLGENVKISGKPGISFSNKLYPDPVFVVGNNTFIGHGTDFSIAQCIEIGANCFIAGGVSIADNDGHPIDYIKRRNNLPPDSSKAVYIGNDVWIGRKAMIMKGVTVGDRSIVAAGAIVTKDILPDTVVGGNPAKVIKRLNEQV